MIPTPAKIRAQIEKMRLLAYGGEQNEQWLNEVAIGAAMLSRAADHIETLYGFLYKIQNHDISIASIRDARREAIKILAGIIPTVTELTQMEVTLLLQEQDRVREPGELPEIGPLR